MAWATLTLAHLKTRISGSEYDALSAAALGSGQVADDVAEDVLADVVQLVRAKVAACAQNTLGDGATVPDELRDAALAIARNRIFTRLPGMGSLNDETRREEVRSAEKLLTDAARCELRIEQPTTASSQALSSPEISTITAPTRTATREQQKGLL